MTREYTLQMSIALHDLSSEAGLFSGIILRVASAPRHQRRKRTQLPFTSQCLVHIKHHRTYSFSAIILRNRYRQPNLIKTGPCYVSHYPSLKPPLPRCNDLRARSQDGKLNGGL